MLCSYRTAVSFWKIMMSFTSFIVKHAFYCLSKILHVTLRQLVKGDKQRRSNYTDVLQLY